ncbi:MAG: pyrroloquinoline quinone-dependent dehydrogenase [Rhodospirillaceae bacterium]|nr:pyrroloquinoline quinone-dependent dehydrogenase [Rhodospirillaceae bacterium]
MLNGPTALRAICALAVCALPALAQQAPSPERRADWPRFGNDAGGSQFSPLDQITPDNVRKLDVVWEHRSGDVSEKGSATGATSYEVVPIHANGMLYYCTPLNRVFALDPATGAEKWVFDPHAPGADGKPLIDKPRRAGNCRGVAYWEAADPEPGKACERRVFRADGHGHTYAIDADTGKLCTDFAAYTDHPGYVSHWDLESYGEGTSRGMSSPPTVIGDVVVTTQSSNDGIANASDGLVRGWDVRTGELKWSFNPIPDDKRDQTGAANVWSTTSADLQRGLVFLPTTSPSTDYFGGGRMFDIPYADATVAVSAATGEVAWHFQTVRHDLFDYDLVGHPLLVTIRKDGRDIDVAITQTKMGWLFVNERDTGAPVWPVEERPVPQSDVPGETSSPTQPVPVGIDAFAGQHIDRDKLFGLTPLDKAWCQGEFDTMRYEGLYTPPSLQGTLLFPSALGGGNWGGAAFDPKSNTLIIKAENLASRLKFVKKDNPEAEDKVPSVDYLTRPLIGTPYRAVGEVFMSPLGVPCTPTPWGTLTAIDMGTGKTKWQIPLGSVKKYGVTIPYAWGWGSPNIGGPIVTGGGLIFVGATMDEKFRALEIATGKELWQAKLPAPGMALPMTYMADGRQFVVIAAGGNARAETALSDAIVAFALPRD